MGVEDYYNTDESLYRIANDSLARATVGAKKADDYSFLPQVSTGYKVVGNAPVAPTFEQNYGSSIGPAGGGMSSVYGSSKGYADYPTVPMPTLASIETPKLTAPVLPEYTAPERDAKALQAAQTKAAAPGLQRLRRGLDKGIQSTRSIDNPTERKFQLSGMLESYGLNLGDIISKADMTGLNEYEREYSTQLDQAKTRYGAEVSEATSKASVANQNLVNQYQQQLADRNAMFGLQSQIFARQPISRQASSFNDTGAISSPIGKVGRGMNSIYDFR